jgi:glycosyltransferase involved in cell wall biosynthesis
VENVYAHSDIFALLSQSEGFPLALSEAMAAGIPAIGLKKCFGIRDLIRDDKTGFLVDEDPVVIQRIFRQLMENKKKRMEMGFAARESIKRYKPDYIWGQWEKLLEKIV